jgi:lipopolysaccharide/colanic/teichoic acid biosynthesis glycosyltransferase
MVKEQVLKVFFTEGYVSTNRILDRIYNFILSLILIVISFPVGLLIYISIRCQDGGPAFYKGIRLGINKKPFIMYKFRTLIPDAEVKIGGKLLPSRNEFETKSGKFLRNTHLERTYRNSCLTPVNGIPGKYCS